MVQNSHVILKFQVYDVLVNEYSYRIRLHACFVGYTCMHTDKNKVSQFLTPQLKSVIVLLSKSSEDILLILINYSKCL